ncbi:MAG: pantetheine-phosphate adenylyltransferase [Anaerolineae bacterium]|jgi:pantetheine-phosphate adenylyltransferase
MTIAIYPGSFDPVHNGHIDIALRAAVIFEKLIVAVYARPYKDVLFTVTERAEMFREALQDTSNIEVCEYDCLTVDLAKQLDAQAIVRGMRMSSDFDLEYQMALTNKALDTGIETVCLFTNLNRAFLSSSTVKQIAIAGGDVSGMVPEHVRQALAGRFPRHDHSTGHEGR